MNDLGQLPASPERSAQSKLSEARQLVDLVVTRLRAARARAVQAEGRKKARALAAARGDAEAVTALAKANEALTRSRLEIEDLAAAEQAARAEVEAAERVAVEVQNRERADRIEVLAQELAASAAAIDAKFAELAAAFEARGRIAQELYRLAPALHRDAGLRIEGPNAATRAARACGLHAWLKLPWSGGAQHEVALAAGYPIPEIRDLIAKLRAEVEKQKAA